jgi:hypothetical protein
MGCLIDTKSLENRLNSSLCGDLELSTSSKQNDVLVSLNMNDYDKYPIINFSEIKDYNFFNSGERGRLIGEIFERIARKRISYSLESIPFYVDKTYLIKDEPNSKNYLFSSPKSDSGIKILKKNKKRVLREFDFLFGINDDVLISGEAKSGYIDLTKEQLRKQFDALEEVFPNKKNYFILYAMKDNVLKNNSYESYINDFLVYLDSRNIKSIVLFSKETKNELLDCVSHLNKQSLQFLKKSYNGQTINFSDYYYFVRQGVLNPYLELS